ncbi:hypothetical protein BC828DRAFT_408090 [Blastocladiella britannica]|nr:hypothetical protein BC828DRAFT_408090 [Blastocladiella britannica]
MILATTARRIVAPLAKHANFGVRTFASAPNNNSIQKQPQSLVEKIKAFVAKNRAGISVLLKQDVPRYRELKTQPQHLLSRRDALFVARVRSDLRTLVPFGVCLLTLPEAIPLLVVRGYVPSTCLDASDVAKARAKQRVNRDKIASGLWTSLARSETINPRSLLAYASVRDLAARNRAEFEPSKLQWKQQSFALRFLGVSPYLPTPLFLGRRLGNACTRLEDDDRRLAREGLKDLTLDEVHVAAEARGISTVVAADVAGSAGGREPTRTQLEASIRQWIEMNTDPTIPKGLVVFARITQYAHLTRTNGGAM